MTYEKDLLSDGHSRGVNFKFPRGGGPLKYNVAGIAWPQFFKTPPNGWRVLKPKTSTEEEYTLFPPIHTLNRDFIDTVFTLGFEKVPYFLKIVVFDTLNGVTWFTLQSSKTTLIVIGYHRPSPQRRNGQNFANLIFQFYFSSCVHRCLRGAMSISSAN